MSGFSLDDLDAIIEARGRDGGAESYTATLLKSGTAYCARKFGEEAVEAVVAAVEGDGLEAEAADVLYHLLVLLRAGGVPLQAVMAELSRRTGQGGLAEKAARRTE
jgi:phosphoribosyl-ATP pyrophosphohydrolase